MAKYVKVAKKFKSLPKVTMRFQLNALHIRIVGHGKSHSCLFK